MQSMDRSQFTSWLNNLEKIIEEMPDIKRELHTKIADKLESIVDSEAPEITGKLKSYQEKKVGSKGGFAKIQPKSGRTIPYGKGKSYAFGHITNSVVSGHRISPIRTGNNYRPRIKVPRVPGNNFYGRAGTRAEAEVTNMVDGMLNELAQKLGG